MAGSGLIHLRALTHLKRLILSQVFNGLTDVDLHALRGLPALTFVGLGQVPLNDVALENLAHIPTLRELDVSGNSEFTQQGLQQLTTASKLTMLDLSYSRTEPSALAPLMALFHLEKLYLAGLDLSGTLGFVKNLTQLRQLDLSDSTTTDDDLEQLSGLSRLESLNLENTAVVGAGLHFLQDTQGLRSLKWAG